MSRTLAANARARSDHRGSPARSSPYSFIDEPHPAAFTATSSTPARSKMAMVRRAKRRASESRPACSASAPQQPCSRGAMTSQPSAARTRTLAALTFGKTIRCTQPVSRPTESRRLPSAAVRSGTRVISECQVTRGASVSIALTRDIKPSSALAGRRLVEGAAAGP